MSTELKIPMGEQGYIRVFALSLDGPDAEKLKANPSSQAQALGIAGVTDSGVEVFPVSDLGDMPLPAYLVEGAGALPDGVEKDRLKLAALEGWVMVVYSSAFDGAAQMLTLDAALTLIGTYPQEGVDWSDKVEIETPSALPYQGQTPVKKRPSDAAMSGRIAMLALLVAFGVVGLMLWVGS